LYDKFATKYLSIAYNRLGIRVEWEALENNTEKEIASKIHDLFIIANDNLRGLLREQHSRYLGLELGLNSPMEETWKMNSS
jgi:hypothetical protein